MRATEMGYIPTIYNCLDCGFHTNNCKSFTNHNRYGCHEAKNKDVRKAIIKQMNALKGLITRFPKSETFSGYEVRRTIRLEMNRYKQPHSS